MFRRTLLCLALLSAPVLAQLTPHSYGGDTSRPAPLPAKPLHTLVSDQHIPGLIEVKFAHGSALRLAEDGLFAEAGLLRDDVNTVLASAGARGRAMFSQSEAFLDAWRASGEARSGIALHDLNLFWFVDVPADQSVAEVCDALNALPIVSLAWPAPSGGDPVAPPGPWAGGDPGATPDFSGQQGYRAPAPAGVDAQYGNTFSGGRGIGVTVADCETGWTDDHEDLAAKLDGSFVGFTPAPYPWDHGTAVMGEILGGDNGFGVTGIASDADGVLSTHSPQGQSQNIPGSVANGAAAVGPGDVVVIEIQCFAGPPSPHPCEYDPAIFATVQTATANGIHVFAAAGNGANDLDGAAYGGAFDLNVKDSGAVLVGASDGVNLSAASFSNHGSRCTSSGWGWNVASTGYGDLQNGVATVDYTATFSGTSSATPIVTGAAVDLIAIHREAFGHAITPLELRALLADTGTPWQGALEIGNRPDLRAAVAALGVPQVSLSGNWVPGGSIAVTSHGEPGDTYILAWSLSLAPAPIHVAPWGYVAINPAGFVVLPVAGTLGPGGTSTDTYFIPDNPGLAGMVTYFQGAQLFNTKPGTGSVSNYAQWRFP